MKDSGPFLASTPSRLVVLLFALCACSNSVLEHRIAEKIRGRDGSTIRMSEVTEFSWSRLHVFPPYTPVDKINADLGFKWLLASRTGIDMDDGHTLLVFMQDARVVTYVMQPRSQGDFARLYRPEGYRPNEAVFVIAHDEHDWKYLQWVQV